MLVISQMALATVTQTPTQPSALRSISAACFTSVSTHDPSSTGAAGPAASDGGTIFIWSSPSDPMNPATNGANCAPISVLATSVTTTRMGMSPSSVL